MISTEFDIAQFVQAAGDAIVAANADGTIIFWNSAAERIFGYAKDEALGHSLDMIIPDYRPLPRSYAMTPPVGTRSACFG